MTMIKYWFRPDTRELSCEGWWRWRLVGFDYFVLSTTTYLKWKIIKLVHLDWLIINFLLVHCCTHDILTTKLNICQTQFGGLMHKSEVLLSTLTWIKCFFKLNKNSRLWCWTLAESPGWGCLMCLHDTNIYTGSASLSAETVYNYTQYSDTLDVFTLITIISHLSIAHGRQVHLITVSNCL